MKEWKKIFLTSWKNKMLKHPSGYVQGQDGLKMEEMIKNWGVGCKFMGQISTNQIGTPNAQNVKRLPTVDANNPLFC